MRLETHFDTPLESRWHLTQIGAGKVIQTSGLLRLQLPSSTAEKYHDAQITDYAGKTDFVWKPPLRLTVRARFESPHHRLRGTAGFGFWNHPFVPGERGFRLPKAAWFFFGSPPNNIALAKDVPGSGWKAATIDATHPPFLALLPTAPIGFLLMRIPALYQRLWPIGQRAINVSEALLDSALLWDMHTYTLDWHHNNLTFAVDGLSIHQTTSTPRGPLGFIAWIDNQYAVVTPRGQFGFGLLTVETEQSLLLEHITIETTSES